MSVVLVYTAVKKQALKKAGLHVQEDDNIATRLHFKSGVQSLTAISAMGAELVPYEDLNSSAPGTWYATTVGSSSSSSRGVAW